MYLNSSNVCLSRSDTAAYGGYGEALIVYSKNKKIYFAVRYGIRLLATPKRDHSSQLRPRRPQRPLFFSPSPRQYICNLKLLRWFLLRFKLTRCYHELLKAALASSA